MKHSATVSRSNGNGSGIEEIADSLEDMVKRSWNSGLPEIGVDPVTQCLIEHICGADLTVAELLACVAAIRTVRCSSSSTGAAPISVVMAALRELRSRPRTSLDLVVTRAIEALHRAVLSGASTTSAAIAAELFISAAHMGRLMKGKTGLDFRQWRRALRMRIAVRLLGDPNLRVSEIAYAVGFEHPSQFDREFRLFTGVAPREFRRIGVFECR